MIFFAHYPPHSDGSVINMTSLNFTGHSQPLTTCWVQQIWENLTVLYPHHPTGQAGISSPLHQEAHHLLHLGCILGLLRSRGGGHLITLWSFTPHQGVSVTTSTQAAPPKHKSPTFRTLSKRVYFCSCCASNTSSSCNSPHFLSLRIALINPLQIFYLRCLLS